MRQLAHAVKLLLHIYVTHRDGWIFWNNESPTNWTVLLLLFQCNLSNQRDAVFGKGGMAFRWEIGSSTVQTNSTGLNSLSFLPPRCIPFGFFLFGYPSVFLFVLVSPLFSISQSLTVSRSFCYLNLNVSNLNFSPSSTEKPRNENKTRETVRKRSLRNKFRPGLNNKTKRHRELSRREWNKN
jgi:hypothetical protein